MWQYFTDLFDFLPIAAVIDQKIFCVHAGLSPTILNIDDINSIQRIQEIPHEGPFADLMWSDPTDSENMCSGFTLSARGAGYMFGQDVVDRFLQENGVDKIFRAH